MVTLRLATIDDLGIFRELWAEYLKTQEELGDYIRATDRTLDVFEAFFKRALEEGSGVVVIAEDGKYACGALLRVALDLIFDTTLGKTAMSMGLYVRKEFQNQGIGKKMAELAATELLKNGFDSVVAEALKGNILGGMVSDAIGYKTVKQSLVLELGGNS